MKRHQSTSAQRYHKYLRRWHYFWRTLRREPDVMPADDVAIDVVIPIIEKDLDTLPLCIEGVRRCITNRIAQMHLIAPVTPKIAEAAKHLGVKLVDENTILGYGVADINIVTTTGQNRSGWIFQQLLKLAGNVGESRYFLVIDADHILLRPHTMVDKHHRLVMYQSREYNAPYYACLRRLLGIDSPDTLSYVAHKMIFDRQSLEQMKREIESRNPQLGSRWDEIIIRALDLTTQSSFSEYETYGHYITADSKILLPWRQKTLRKEANGTMADYDTLHRRYARRYRSVTFPDYMKKKH